MTNERRAAIIAQSLENLHRYKSSLASAEGVSSCTADATARPADLSRSGRAFSPPEDPVAAWRKEGEALERQRELGRAQLRAEEAAHRAGEQDASDLFWRSVNTRIAQALAAEREFMNGILSDALQAANELADATNNNFDQLDQKLDALGKLLQQLREGNEAALQRASAMDDILPNPLPSRRAVN